MTRTPFLLATLAAALCASSARADILPLVTAYPSTYTPGTPFTFEVRAPNLVDFTRYNVEFVLTAGTPGGLTATAAPPADPNQYPFPTTPTFAPGTANGNEFRLTIADGVSPERGVVTTPGGNDLLAVVTVNPSAGLTGPIQISVNPTTLRFDVNQEVTPTIEPPPTVTILQGETPPDTNPVPAPAAWIGMAFGGLALAARRRFARSG